MNNSYTPTTWATGDIITAEKLNKIEQGIANAGSGNWLVVNAISDSNNDTTTLDKTWQEIYDAFPMVYVYVNEDSFNGKVIIEMVANQSGNYMIGAGFNFSTDSPNGYPSRGN